MNFKELAHKLQNIQEGRDVECAMGECGDDGMGLPAAIMGITNQSHPEESLTMNVTINSKGAGGIRDLMDILKGIDDHSHDDHHGDMKPGMPDDDDGHALFGSDDIETVIDDSYKNSAHGDAGPTTFGIDAVTTTGDDMFSKGDEAPKQAGGGNPWNMRNESLVHNLSSLYNDIKTRKLQESSKTIDQGNPYQKRSR
jgi:hypothetical protein